jgi:hypothetical protein
MFANAPINGIDESLEDYYLNLAKRYFVVHLDSTGNPLFKSQHWTRWGANWAATGLNFRERRYYRVYAVDPDTAKYLKLELAVVWGPTEVLRYFASKG